MEWTEAGIADPTVLPSGSTVWDVRSPNEAAVTLTGEANSVRAVALLQVVHRTIAAVTAALDQFAFNVAVARLHELTNALAEAHRSDGAPIRI